MYKFDLEKSVATRRLYESNELPEGPPEWTTEDSFVTEELEEPAETFSRRR